MYKTAALSVARLNSLFNAFAARILVKLRLHLVHAGNAPRNSKRRLLQGLAVAANRVKIASEVYHVLGVLGFRRQDQPDMVLIARIKKQRPSAGSILTFWPQAGHIRNDHRMESVTEFCVVS